MKALAAVALLLAAAAAGCVGGGGPSSSASPSQGASSTSTASVPTGPAFDGQQALGYVRNVALNPDGSPRYRIPGSPGQRDGAVALWSDLAVPGWERAWQNFTGSDYLALNRSVVAGYTPGPHVVRAYCSEADEANLPNLPFHNLFAYRPGPRPDAPMLLLAAHWDSQMHSDNDVEANRSKPDPGANDGASGVGLLLSLMRTLDRPLPFAVGILLVDGEDGFFDCYPDAGSLYYAQHPPRLGQASLRPAAFVLLDMVGDPGARYPRESNSHDSAPQLLDLLWRHGQSTPYGAQHFIDAATTIDDDHLAFIQAGVPSVDIIDAGRPSVFPPQWDTAHDTVDLLDAKMLALVGQVLVDALADPALADLLAK